MHENWYKMGKGIVLALWTDSGSSGAWKNHSRDPRGFIHLAIQLKDNKSELTLFKADFMQTKDH